MATLCLAIFLVDTLSPLDMAIAVLYGVVVLVSSSWFGTRGLIAIGAGCAGLAVGSFLIIHAQDYNLASVMRCLVSIAAIGVTTLLCLRNEATTASLRDQAALLDLSHDAIFVRAPSDAIVYWNGGAERLYGWSREEALGHAAGTLLRTVLPAPRSQIMASLHATGFWEGEVRHTTRDGREVTCLSRWSAQRDARGRSLGTLETNHDITARKTAEHDLRQAEAALAEVTRVSTLGALTASIAHEVNQPLAAVITSGEACLRWLRRPVPDIAEAEETVQRMIANGRRASEVIARLRALARRDPPDHRPIDLSELVEDSLPLLEWELASHRVRLALRLAPALPRIGGDRGQLQQVLINLALNALHAMDAVPEADRTLTIRTALRQAGAGPGNGGEVAVTVEDAGPGAPPETLESLFAPFFSTRDDGMGLGLSVARSIVEAHGGRLVAQPGAAAGLCLTFTLPVLSEPSLAPAEGVGL
ncbi:two-component system sensor histidine kinase NtrB [Ancylobacter lacus]|uniref:two-component system sensor histidine kinase NtrB n=1 Tax=Ancylobacter lacus TaxID=2579970 RepID=UPI001BD09CEE|nr:PAS domain S-box protein [Ancylobacter lacus]